MVGGGVGWWGGVVWLGGMYSHFHVQPNYSMDVVLCLGWGCDNTGSKLWNIKLKLLQDLSYQEGEGGTMISLFVYG